MSRLEEFAEIKRAFIEKHSAEIDAEIAEMELARDNFSALGLVNKIRLQISAGIVDEVFRGDYTVEYEIEIIGQIEIVVAGRQIPDHNGCYIRDGLVAPVTTVARNGEQVPLKYIKTVFSYPTVKVRPDSMPMKLAFLEKLLAKFDTGEIIARLISYINTKHRSAIVIIRQNLEGQFKKLMRLFHVMANHYMFKSYPCINADAQRHGPPYDAQTTHDKISIYINALFRELVLNQLVTDFAIGDQDCEISSMKTKQKKHYDEKISHLRAKRLELFGI